MITVSDLVARYGEAVAVDGVSLSLSAGEFVVLTGPNGSGKTTLVQHFNALRDPDEGSVTVDGTAATADPLAARTRVGMVFQHPRDQFVAATVGADVAFGPENLGLDREEIDRRVREALAAVNLSGRREERVTALSGGEQARLAIAGALAMEPAYLVLDEPFTSLDEPARRSVLSRLVELNDDGMGIVVVTHDLRGTLGPADRLLAMVDGRLVVDTTPAAATDALAGIEVYVPNGG